mmetsp:Transcript_7415/g.17902  ORF Transcript_7415/g.17902 Transcript_7415/m.17902 type:complete len:211 (-) Transcript_7415:288-920(-)
MDSARTTNLSSQKHVEINESCKCGKQNESTCMMDDESRVRALASTTSRKLFIISRKGRSCPAPASSCCQLVLQLVPPLVLDVLHSGGGFRHHRRSVILLRLRLLLRRRRRRRRRGGRCGFAAAAARDDYDEQHEAETATPSRNEHHLVLLEEALLFCRSAICCRSRWRRGGIISPLLFLRLEIGCLGHQILFLRQIQHLFLRGGYLGFFC